MSVGFFAPNGVVYIIVPTVAITNEMENNMKSSFNATKDTIRKNETDTERLFKIKEPVSSAFNGYKWYNLEEIMVEMAKPEWDFEDV